MSDRDARIDAWVRAVSQRARELADADKEREEWEGLALGEASEEQVQALEARAERSDADRRAFEAFRPLDPLAEARIVRAARREVRVTRFRRLVPWLAGAALAAGLTFALWPPDAMPPLPRYGIELTGGDRAVRSTADSPDVPVLHRGSRLELVLRPGRAPEGPVEARAFAVRDGRATPLGVHPEERDGAFRIAGLREQLLPPGPGEWTIAVAVGRPGDLPDADAVADALRVEPDGWQLLVAQVVTAE